MSLIFKNLRDHKFNLQAFENSQKFRILFSTIEDITGFPELNSVGTKLAAFPFNAVIGAFSDEEPVGIIIAGFDGYRGRVYHLAVKSELIGSGLDLNLTSKASSEMKLSSCKRVMIYSSLNEGSVNQELLKAVGFELFSEGSYYKADYSIINSINQSEKVSIRELKTADWEVVRGLIFGEGRWTGVGDDFEGFRTFVTHACCKVFLAEVNGNSAGLIYSAADGCFGSIWHLFVNPEFRMHGVGRALFNRALSHQLSLGVNHATISVVKNNEGAHKFWSKLSFKPLGKEVYSGNI